jgi:hypothetical protein
MYTELHARSAFSFLEGASLPEEFAEECAKHEMAALPCWIAMASMARRVFIWPQKKSRFARTSARR